MVEWCHFISLVFVVVLRCDIRHSLCKCCAILAGTARIGLKSKDELTGKLASSRSPPDPVDSASELLAAKVSELKSAIQCQNNEVGSKGTYGDKEIRPAKPKKLDLTTTGISKKTADIINSIRQSSSSSSISGSAKGSEKSSRFDNCKEFLRRSDAPTLFDVSSTSKQPTNKKFPTSKSISSLGSVLVESKGILTEVHSGVNVKNSNNSVSAGSGSEHCFEDEVEIVSLLEEQIPKYKLRADTLTQFSGCQNQDFVGIPYPVLKDYSPVTPEQAYLTLGYFLLSGSRVSQMTKTFADLDALQNILEEKEKDLELAARIGQQLLEDNQALRGKVTTLESENKESIETITQLKYELNFKAQLLEIYNADTTDSADVSKVGTPVDAISSVATVLERRLHLLEEENQLLRADACQLAEDVEKTEAQEKYLVEDAISRLNESNRRINKISDELERKTEEVKAQQDEISGLDEELKAFQLANRELVDENLELRNLVEALSNNHNQLGTELTDLRENYVEVVSILKETQEQLREAQRQKDEGADVVTVFDSLAYEIDSSVARHRRSSDYFRRTFDTVRCANSKLADPTSVTSCSLMSTTTGLGSSGVASLDSSASHELVNSNFNSLLLESGLGSSLCYSPAGSSTPGGTWRLPEKLQIVKPLEGSSTLQIWSSLATPHLGNLLEKRPGVQTRVERPIEGIGINTILALTPNTLMVSTPAVFTFVTTSSIRDTTTTIFSSSMSSKTASTCSISSGQSSVSDCHSPIPTSRDDPSHKPGTSASFYASGDYLKTCETPQNSPMEGNSRPMSPSFKGGGDGISEGSSSSKSKTVKTLYAVYDTLCSRIGGLGSTSARTFDYTSSLSSQKYDLTSKLGRVEVSFESSRLQAPHLCAPPRPGTGALDKILLEPD